MIATSTTITGLGFPEALRWRAGSLWFSDMFRSRVLRWRPGEAPEIVVDASSGCPETPGGLGWLPDGTLLIVDTTERRIISLAPDSGCRRPEVFAELDEHLTHAANDMHVDTDGTAWVGGYGFDPELDTPTGSRLVRVDRAGATPWGDPLVFPNGCERAADGSLVVAETFADRISVLDREGRRAATVGFPAGSGPDGLSLDSAGGIVVALAFAGRIDRVDSRGSLSTVFRADPIVGGPGSGPVGCFDCAVSPDGRWLAVSTASQDEALASRVDTGEIRLIGFGSRS